MAPFCVRGRFHPNSKIIKSLPKNVKKHKKGGMKNTQEKIESLKAEMEEIGVEQQNVREAQQQVREKFECVENECEKLKRETRMIIQQTARTQIKLALMFRIVKASEQADHATVATLTHMLREIIEEENKESNLILFDETYGVEENILSQSKELHEAARMILTPKSWIPHARVTEADRNIPWQCPNACSFRINVDSARRIADGFATCGGVICDHEG